MLIFEEFQILYNQCSINISSIYIVRLSMTSARSKGVTHRSRDRAFAPFITFIFLSILARDLCVTPLLLADGILSRTIYSSTLVTRAGLQDFSKQPKSTRLCEKETICFNASPKSYESILKEQKAMKLTFEILIPLSIFKQTEDASPICMHHDLKKPFCRNYVNWFLIPTIPNII